MSQFHSVKIAAIKRETKDAVSIVFDIPEDLKNQFQYIAGQYITLKTTIDGTDVRRAYSICSSPNSNEIRVAVKRVKNGFFSIYATSELKVGDVIEISKPEGKFILSTSANNANNYLAFGAGSGITPIMAMVKSVLENEPNSKFVLVYGNKNTFETLFFDEINTLKRTYSDRFFVQFVYSKEQPEGSLFGRIDSSVVNFVLKKHVDSTFNDVFLCGPEQMINTVKETLFAQDFNDDSIHYELFTAPKSNDKDEAENLTLDGNSEITVMLDDEETTFTMAQKETILTAALKNDLDAPYSCQGGICSSCIAKVTEGKVTMAKNTILSEDEVAEGLILTCQAHPTTAKITIDFDEV
ncbi:MAG: 2Fe-2S iron-sulfur cluster-binding protein [Flavobacteriaceae bacterium]